jgi:hypothetical protein
MLGPLRI